jgi:MarR family transcriptional repressor of emrRAB
MIAKHVDAAGMRCHAYCMKDRLLANQLGALWSVMTSALRQRFGGRSESTVAAILTLAHWEPMTATELGHVIGLSQPGSARLVDKLVAEGVVRRYERAGGRDIGLGLTPAGRKLARSIQSARLESYEELMAPLDPEERQVLHHLVQKMLAGAVESRDGARFTCRFCDHARCDGPCCPVGTAATELERAAGGSGWSSRHRST